MEFLILLTQGEGKFGHAYMDALGWVMMVGLAVFVAVLFVKISISGMVRGVKLVKGNMEVNRRIEEKMEHAKMIREL